jgi:hypothetical protein
VNRRVSNATETTPLFLGEESGEGHNKPLCVAPRRRRAPRA